MEDRQFTQLVVLGCAVLAFCLIGIIVFTPGVQTDVLGASDSPRGMVRLVPLQDITGARLAPSR